MWSSTRTFWHPNQRKRHDSRCVFCSIGLKNLLPLPLRGFFSYLLDAIVQLSKGWATCGMRYSRDRPSWQPFQGSLFSWATVNVYLGGRCDAIIYPTEVIRIDWDVFMRVGERVSRELLPILSSLFDSWLTPEQAMIDMINWSWSPQPYCKVVWEEE